MSFSNLSPETERQIRAALESRRKIEAIKIYREATGLGLKESKEAIEAIEKGTPFTTAESSSRPSVEKRGCGSSAIFLGISAGALILLYHFL